MKILKTLSFIVILFTLSLSVFEASAQTPLSIEEFKKQQQDKAAEYLAKQDSDGAAFMESLKGKGREEKLLAIKEFKTKHYAENCEFRENMHKAQVEFVKSRMGNKFLAPMPMADRKLARIEREYSEFKIFHAQKHKENMEFIDKLIADKTKDGAELDKILCDFMQEQKAGAKEFRQNQKEKYQTPGTR